ncbi:MAG: helix-turn-helix domain-containing protein [Candidatus Woesearchaeota archaeon]|jgi:sugar-specific transcriptional regulator TrmB|nr:helix-turn-helix domain-containing protein [Candidatus Woesearchaeota archaeon]MDP7181187.1 helix-turn-helix domain-containing protein [Candidatus Woesearchaeota archaeon]MDP7198192.1 helix-turn-helix domain-containing protein [Candidatus Woesearchaeota archaeon]MDP7467028.1 helix-turn-helix domain-containing protein [Candidatus Woesearchaeota archaeon]MDP7646697.1 helix-turn-helix domain-containing protein [Candidatus Woesearchaeota archaeon]
MNTEALRDIGLTENEIKIYLDLLTSGTSTAYEIGRRTGIYRVHVYDKLEQLMDKGMATHVYRGSKKYFQATDPSKIKHYLEDKQRELASQEGAVARMLPQLKAMANLPKEDTMVEVFKGKEGLKYFLKDIIKVQKEVLVTGIDDAKYQDLLPIFMKQYFRDLRIKRIKERVITVKRKGVFQFGKDIAPSTSYRYLEEAQFNPTNTFVYGDKVVIVTWGAPVTAVMIQNGGIASTYRNHFEHLWKVAAQKV